jgi:RimJ/RimL family protein N-acetyltransferase
VVLKGGHVSLVAGGNAIKRLWPQLDQWLATLLALSDDEVVGCATLVRDDLSWSRHVGELRVIVVPAMRGKGLGHQLTQECFALALELGLEKLTAQMTVDQRGAIAVFEALGFRPEALLRDQVKDRDGKMHDIVVLGHDVAGVQATFEAYGVTIAF